MIRNGLTDDDVTSSLPQSPDVVPVGAERRYPAGIPNSEHIIQFFEFTHLPPHLQDVSAPFHALAHRISGAVPRNPERTVALRKLLEAKDACVRAVLAK